ncbi:DNA gyrase inhibitor YacG [Neisseria dentiae]|uniref:DNA gyrase inhibitor YacG n=1 Tax=Neisseria dentiae TaxID=194197 RepID=A0A1X3D5W2_9NEIS|nr:DNA gyrase inhibitor YacG [Neisseria dentiae]OSI15111.1 DNA gyrase inhibitor YacG [Neisseria dentiae]QMT45467.1 DNA gyrase inhibitor YacG [Neisseria dentiae]STZ51333.1 zinc-binding protein YacG [Neisseria dentiae]
MTEKTTWVKCPTCRTLTEWSADNPFRPFCSERCKLIDLGAWANEDYAVATQEEEWLLSDEPGLGRKH